jgi:hypothetical protein
MKDFEGYNHMEIGAFMAHTSSLNFSFAHFHDGFSASCYWPQLCDAHGGIGVRRVASLRCSKEKNFDTQTNNLSIARFSGVSY